MTTARLKRLFYDLNEPTAFSSHGPLQRASRASGRNVSAFLEQQPVFSRHKQIRYKFRRRKTSGLFVLSHVQADLVEMSELLDDDSASGKRANAGHRYCLTMIDCYSRYAFVVPLKDKSGASVVRALRSTFDDGVGAFPTYLVTDRGREFVNAQVRAYLTDRHITLAHPESEIKCAMVERFNRTWKTRLYKYLTHAHTRKWIDVVEKITAGINKSHHRIIKASPDQVFRGLAQPADIADNDDNDNNNTSTPSTRTPTARGVAKYAVGDRVRMSATNRVFRKGYRSGWTEEEFAVVQVLAASASSPVAYRLVDLHGEEISGIVYEPELVRAI